MMCPRKVDVTGESVLMNTLSPKKRVVWFNLLKIFLSSSPASLLASPPKVQYKKSPSPHLIPHTDHLSLGSSWTT